MRRDVEVGDERRVAYLAGGIDNLGGIVLVLPLDDLAEGVFDGRVVTLNEVTVDKLDRKAGFACRRVSSEVLKAGGQAGSTERTHQLICCRQWQSCAAWGRP